MESAKAVIPTKDKEMVWFYICFIDTNGCCRLLPVSLTQENVGVYMAIIELIALLVPVCQTHSLIAARKEKIRMSGAVEEVIDKQILGEERNRLSRKL